MTKEELTLEHRITQLEEQVLNLDERLEKFMENDFAHLKNSIDEIKEKINERPTWLITAILGALLSFSVAITTFVLTKGL